MTQSPPLPNTQTDAVVRNRYPSREALPPLFPAPARFGVAGISAGEDVRFNSRIHPEAGPSRQLEAMHLAQALGWASVALGLTEILAPGVISRWLGMPQKRALIGAFGAREIGNGIAILVQTRPKQTCRWVQGRVIGDVADLATLATGLSRDNPKRGRVGLAMGLVAAVTLVDLFCASALSDR